MLQRIAKADPPAFSTIAQLPGPRVPGGSSALDCIDKDIHPIGDDPDLLHELRYLARSGEASVLVAMYDAYVAVAHVFQAARNQPRAEPSEAFLDSETDHAWAKAYAVADCLKGLPSDKFDNETSRVLLDAAFRMGNNLQDVADVAAELVREAQ